MAEDALDCIIIGAGPAGLTAAIYLARFHLRVLVFDGGDSRASWIPTTHNHAGYPGGIAGTELLRRMREQAEEYRSPFVDAKVESLSHADGVFTASGGGREAKARTVLLATGVVNNRPPIEENDHAEGLARGLIRYCPICDGYEVTDKRVGVIGKGAHGLKEAVFLRGYTQDVTLVSPDADDELAPEEAARLDGLGIGRHAGPCHRLRLDGDAIVVPTPEGDLRFDSVYPALGSVIRSDLARGVGAEVGEDGCLTVDAHQRTSVPGLYAAGDVVKGLDQISHAMGEAGVAATTIRNDLADQRPLLR